jgi:hypothetical protein
MRVAGESPNTAYSLSKIFTSRSKVSESKSGPTSIRRPLLNTTFKAQASRRFPSLFFPANSTVTNRLLTVALSSPQTLPPRSQGAAF